MQLLQLGLVEYRTNFRFCAPTFADLLHNAKFLRSLIERILEIGNIVVRVVFFSLREEIVKVVREVSLALVLGLHNLKGLLDT